MNNLEKNNHINVNKNSNFKTAICWFAYVPISFLILIIFLLTSCSDSKKKLPNGY